MPRETRDQAVERADRASKSESLAMAALSAVYLDVPAAHAVARADGETWVLRVYRPEAAHGGILLEVHDTGDGGRPMVIPWYWEDYRRAVNEKLRLLGDDRHYAVGDAVARLVRALPGTGVSRSISC